MTGHLCHITDRKGRESVQARYPLGQRRRYRSASFAMAKYGKRAAYLKALDSLDAMRKGKRIKR